MSIGIALSTLAVQEPEDYLRDADTAMHRAKALGKGRHVVFDALVNA
jgi:PleD family two-component response regulator